MSSPQYDILQLGATGFCGRLIAKYLDNHPQRSQFTFAIAGRSKPKLDQVVKELGLSASVPVLQVDVQNHEQLEQAVKNARVVITTVGPYWKWGTPVVRACARNGVHYVDLTGETPWLMHIINEFDYLATKTGAVIVPSCGYDSLPSDLSAFLSNETLKSLPDGDKYQVVSSRSAHQVKGGISGGTLSTMVTSIEEIPRVESKKASRGFALSPVSGPKVPFKFLDNIVFPGGRVINGAFFFMKPTNKALVDRTYGLLEYRALSALKSKPETHVRRYGPRFNYDEFIAMPSPTRAFLFITSFLVGVGLVLFVPPIKWAAKKLMPQPGEGPSAETMEKNYLKLTNLTKAIPPPGKSPVDIETVIRCRGDPGYLLTSMMISECALSLILPSTSTTANRAGSSELPHLLARRRLPSFGQQGGVLTPVTAFGHVIVERLRETGRFEFESGVVGGSVGDGVESRKNI